MSEWERKNWGRVRHDFSNEHYSTSHLEVIPGQRSSIHYHESRYNTFQVVDAQIIVETFESPVAGSTETPVIIDSILLGPLQTACIKPLVWHRFRTLRRGTIFELYFGDDVRLDDIVRHGVGGPDY